MRTLSIRQPYAELILRGEKTIEYRSRPTRIIGERFYIYASKGLGPWALGDGEKNTGEAQRHRASLNHGWIDPRTLPRGVIVGTAVISHCTKGTPTLRVGRDSGTPTLRVGRDSMQASGSESRGTCECTSGSESRGTYEWHLTSVKRFKKPRKLPAGTQPQPVWFLPFGKTIRKAA